jgi:hypothetical protein
VIFITSPGRRWRYKASMRDAVNHRLPFCPGCGRAMHFARAVSRAGAADILAFECSRCRVTLIEAMPEPRLEPNPAVG